MKRNHFFSVISLFFICLGLLLFSNLGSGKADNTVAEYSYLLDKWSLYKASFLSEDVVKIEFWNRWYADDDHPFKFSHDVDVIYVKDTDNDFEWLDDEHKAFSIILEDDDNSDIDGSILVSFSIAQYEQNSQSYVYLNDKWTLYKAYKLSDELIKVECWDRWIADDEHPFNFSHDIGVFRINDSEYAFEWTDNNHVAFSVILIDPENSNLEEPTIVSFSLENQPDSYDSKAINYAYLNDKWTLYKAYILSENTIKIECWDRWIADEEHPFNFSYDVGLFKVDDPQNEFQWTDNSNVAFTIVLQDDQNSNLEDQSNVAFTIDLASFDSETTLDVYTYQHDNWNLYKALFLSDSTMKIENWGRWVADDEHPFKYEYDVKVINITSSDIDFAWVDNSHSAFKITMEDTENSYWDELSTVFFVKAETVTSSTYYPDIDLPAQGEEVTENDDFEVDTERSDGKNNEIDIDRPSNNSSDFDANELGLVPGAIVNTGTVSNTITWELDSNGIFILRGSGKIRNNSSWRSVISKIKYVIIQPGITSIGDDVFRSHSNLQKVFMSDTVIEIGDSVFAYDKELKSITLPGSIQKFGEYIFMYSGLEECSLEEGITVISDNMFRDAEELVKVILPNTLKEIGDYAFAYCKSIETITIPGSVESFGEFIFMYASLEECIFEYGVTIIGENSFRDAEDLETITLPATLLTIEEYAFAYCKALKSVTIPGSVESINGYAFMYSGIKDCIIENGVVTISQDAFRDAESLKTLILPVSIQKIEDNAFAYTKVKTINYCGSAANWALINISKYSGISNTDVVFDYSYDSPDISISKNDPKEQDSVDNVESIVNDNSNKTDDDLNHDPVIPAEYQNGKLINMEMIGNNITWCYYDNGLLTISGEGKLKDNSAWRSYRANIKYVHIEPGITSIGDQLFRSYESLQGIYIPDTVTSIGDRVFYYCYDLTEIVIPGSVQKMGEYMFYESGLESIYFMEGITEIEQQQFRGANDLQKVHLPNTLKEIGARAFYYCHDLEEFYIPGGVEEIGEYAFYESGLTTCVFGNGITNIDSQAFRGANKLQTIVLPNTLVAIEDRAFYYCDIREIVIPVSVEEIGDYVFYGNNKLKTVYYTGSISDWMSIAMGRNSELEKANIIYDHIQEEFEIHTEDQVFTPSATFTSVPTNTPSPVPSMTPTAVPTETPTPVPTDTPVPTATIDIMATSQAVAYQQLFDRAAELVELGKCDSALLILDTIPDYEGTDELKTECKYQQAVTLEEDGEYIDAMLAFNELGNYKDSSERFLNITLNLKELLAGTASNESTTETPDPTAAPTQVPQITMADPDEVFSVKEFGWTLKSNGYIYYAVILHNNRSDVAVRLPSYRITARDKDGQLLGTDRQVLNEIYPGQDTYFAGMAFSVTGKPATVEIEPITPDSYNLKAPANMDHDTYIPLEVRSISKKSDFLGERYLGEVYNPNAYDLSMVRVCILFRDSSASLIGGECTYVDDVKANKSVPFETLGAGISAVSVEGYAQPW